MFKKLGIFALGTGALGAWDILGAAGVWGWMLVLGVSCHVWEDSSGLNTVGLGGPCVLMNVWVRTHFGYFKTWFGVIILLFYHYFWSRG